MPGKTETAELTPQGLNNVNKVLRHLKRKEQGLFSCVCSILEDSVFVREISQLYPALPVFANLRCGLWYTPSKDRACYFKSTDGHTGQWSFSLVRLNLHLGEEAARAGGAVVVDATRRGKTFPVCIRPSKRSNHPHLPDGLGFLVAGPISRIGR